jgi:hypothetical protein
VVGGKLNDSERERERWKGLGKLLAEELKTAAEKAAPISSVPAFFEAHLRRRLSGKSSVQNREAGDSKIKQDRGSGKNVEGEKKRETSTDDGNGQNIKSIFSIEECRRYADHLHQTNQGILNPGGYATTIHRTGEVDALIESFLNKPFEKKSERVAPTECPDCNGTGYWYPQGKEKGVARCRHEKLKRDNQFAED